MLSNTLRFSGSHNIGSNHVLSELLKSFQLMKPVTRSLTPRWNLTWVLLSLSKAPYEPLSAAPVMELTVKTIFLLAMASARRVSELHALSVEEGSIRHNNDGSISLLPQAGFLAKNQFPSMTPECINIPSLSTFTKDKEDRLLCPVRALRIYINGLDQGGGGVNASSFLHAEIETYLKIPFPDGSNELSPMHIRALQTEN